MELYFFKECEENILKHSIILYLLKNQVSFHQGRLSKLKQNHLKMIQEEAILSVKTLLINLREIILVKLI